MSTGIGYQGKIITLWSVFLLGTLFHTQLGLIPVFHGLSVTTSEAHSISDISWIMWMMLIFFVVPMSAMIATAFTDTRRYRFIHFSITVLFSVLNFLHFVLDLFVQPIIWSQITLMIILFIIGLLLNIVAFKWIWAENHKQGTQSRLYHG